MKNCRYCIDSFHGQTFVVNIFRHTAGQRPPPIFLIFSLVFLLWSVGQKRVKSKLNTNVLGWPKKIIFILAPRILHRKLIFTAVVRKHLDIQRNESCGVGHCTVTWAHWPRGQGYVSRIYNIELYDCFGAWTNVAILFLLIEPFALCLLPFCQYHSSFKSCTIDQMSQFAKKTVLITQFSLNSKFKKVVSEIHVTENSDMWFIFSTNLSLFSRK